MDRSPRPDTPDAQASKPRPARARVTRQRRSVVTAVVGLALASISLAACGGDSGTSVGSVFVTGSSTVEPISIRVAEKADDLGLDVVVEGPGTGDGFKKFCVGEGDVTGASRPIKDEEAQICADNGVDFVELSVAIDGLTVATSHNNDEVECLDIPALYALLGPESEGVKRWSDVLDLAADLGSTKAADLPDEPLFISGPGEESGTYDAFVTFAIKDLADERGQEEWSRADYVSSSNDNLIVDGIENSDHSLGWIGFAYYKADVERLKAIEIVGANQKCIAPTDETLADGTYPFSRPLFIYVNTQHAAENPAVRSYVDLYLSDEGIASVTEAGYVAETDDDLAAARSAWEAAL